MKEINLELYSDEELESLQDSIAKKLEEKTTDTALSKALDSNKDFVKLESLIESIFDDTQFDIPVSVTMDICNIDISNYLIANDFNEQRISSKLLSDANFCYSDERDWELPLREFKSKDKVIKNKLSSIKKAFDLLKKISKATNISTDMIYNYTRGNIR